MVNRQEFNSNRILPPNSWGSAISQIVDLPAMAEIMLDLSYNPQSGKLDITANVTALQSLQGDNYLSLILIEDKVIKPQRTNDPAYPGGVIMNYEHNHVFRKDINSTWGDLIFPGNTSVGESFSGSWSVNIDSQWQAGNCSVVAFIYKAGEMNVLQAEQKKVTGR
jgi:hypothetical protein